MKRLLYPSQQSLAIAGFSALTLILIAQKAHAGDSGLLGGLVTQPIKTVTTTTQNITQPIIGAVNTTVNGIPNAVNSPKLSGLVAPLSVDGNIITGTTNTAHTTIGKLPTVDLVGDGLTEIALDKDSAKLMAKQSKSISMTTQQTERLLDNVINTKGIGEASSVSVVNGVIVLGAIPSTKVIPAKTGKAVTIDKNKVREVQTAASDLSITERIKNGFTSFFYDEAVSIRNKAYDEAESNAILGR